MTNAIPQAGQDFDAARRVMWEPPTPADADTVGAALRALGARRWQVALTAPLLVEAVRAGTDAVAAPAEPDDPAEAGGSVG